MRGIVWFRRDLRLHDNPALEAACRECSQVVPLFVFDEPLLQSQVFGTACVNFMLGCLDALSASLADRGLSLQWRLGQPVEETVTAAREWNADVVYWNRDYEPCALERDRAVQQRLAQMGLPALTFKDHVVFESEEVRGATGEPLQRFSAYRTRWWSKWWATAPQALPIPVSLCRDKLVPLPFRPMPTVRELGYDQLTPWIEPGESNARKRLARFIAGPVHSYVNGRNLLAIDGSSKLSPHFRFGTLSTRTAIHAALGAGPAAGGRRSRTDLLSWIDEIIWREFFQQVMSAFPRVADEPFRAAAVPPPREPGPESDRLFQAWRHGRTGYPIIDAGMRQLNRTGWMPNRMRMIVASFLIKDLRIDWQSGERYFMRQLIDADTAVNNGNWQWCASTGADAMRGYRIFNPALQSKKFDPDGAYIREYVPELKMVPTKWVHEPHLMTPDEQSRRGFRIGADYAAPIVDHQQARVEYLDLSKRKVTR